MLEKTLRNALVAYRIEVCSEKNHTERERENIIKKISECQNYLNDGNKAKVGWMTDNHSIISKAVKVCYRTIYFQECDEEEQQDLNKCMIFYKKFYENTGIEF